jgi:hypothetical protein
VYSQNEKIVHMINFPHCIGGNQRVKEINALRYNTRQDARPKPGKRRNGVLECWNVGIFASLQYSNTPILQYFRTGTLHRHTRKSKNSPGNVRFLR